MATLTRFLPVFSLLVFFISCTEGTHLHSCHRVFPVQLTAAAMPCRYICAQYFGDYPEYRVRWENDGTYCQNRGKHGVCWNGQCLTRYQEEDQWSQQAEATSKVPLRIRKKRDVTSAGVKGGTSTKTAESSVDSSFTTKGIGMTKTVKATSISEGTKSAAAAGLEGNYITGFTSQQTGTGTKNSMQNAPNPDVDPFAVKGAGSGSDATEAFFSRNAGPAHMSGGIKGGNVKITIRRGPNGRTVTTRTMRRLIITKGPTKTVRRIIIKHGPVIRTGNLMHGGSNTFSTKTVKVSVNRGSIGGTNGFIVGGNTGANRKTSQMITLHTRKSVISNPISSVVRTVQQERISGGQNAGGTTTATKTVSTVAVTKAVRPSVSVINVTKETVTPSTIASQGASSEEGATLRGLEVEVPGYTAGLRHHWKWVLARRVGVYPPYVQVLDPEVLFHKLGLRNPNLPSLPGQVQNILNKVPVHPVGSDIYGFLLSSKILERIRGFTEGVNGLTKLRSILSSSNTQNQDNSNLLKTLFTGTESSPSGSAFLQKLLVSSLSGPANNPLNSPYSRYLSSSYGGLFDRPYGDPWAPFLGGQFPASPWTPYNVLQSQLRSFGRNPQLDSSGISKSSIGEDYMISEDGNTVPSAEMPTSENPESLTGGSSYMKSLLDSISTGSRYRPSINESPLPASEKLARALREEKLLYLLKSTNDRSSIVHKINKALQRRHYHNVLPLLRQLGIRQNTRLYNTIVRHILLSRKPRKFGSHKVRDVLSMLLERSGNNNEDTLRYLPTISQGLPRSVEPLEARRNGPHESSSELIELLENLRRPESTKQYSPLAEILTKHRRHPSRSRNTFETPRREQVIEDLLQLSGRQPTSEKTSELSKEITKALLSSGQGPISTYEAKPRHLSKLVSVQSATNTEARPHRISHANVFSSAYQTTGGPTPAQFSFIPATPLALDVTRQVPQPSQPAVMLGINGFHTATSGQPLLQPYPQFVPRTYFPNEGSRLSDQSTSLNRQYVASTGSMYASPQGQSATTMVTGTGGYSGYAPVPTSTAYMSQYAAQPYYLGTSLYGGHPHYIVEGHEAPGTRWQLRVWRHHPGVSYVAPGFTGFQSSHLGSVVAQARETATSGLQLGSQPGQFGFATYRNSLPGGSIAGGTSQYVVKAPDGSIMLSRQALPYGSINQVAPTSSVVVSQTKTMTKTTSGDAVPSVSSGLSSNSFQTTVEGSTSSGATKSESLSETSQAKEPSLFSSAGPTSDSQSKESLFSSGGVSSSSGQSDSELSQSKLRR